MNWNYLQAAASAAELQNEKIDARGVQNSTFDTGIMRFGCLEGPRPGISSIFIDFHWFSLILEVSEARKSNPLWRPVAACGSLWRPVAACAARMDSPIYRFLDFGGILSAGWWMQDWWKRSRGLEAAGWWMEDRLEGGLTRSSLRSSADTYTYTYIHIHVHIHICIHIVHVYIYIFISYHIRVRVGVCIRICICICGCICISMCKCSWKTYLSLSISLSDYIYIYVFLPWADWSCL